MAIMTTERIWLLTCALPPQKRRLLGGVTQVDLSGCTAKFAWALGRLQGPWVASDYGGIA